MILLTDEKIESLRTPRGGFNRATAEALGVSWPLQRGWKLVLIGSEVSDKRWKEAVRAAATERHFFRGNAWRRRRRR